MSGEGMPPPARRGSAKGRRTAARRGRPHPRAAAQAKRALARREGYRRGANRLSELAEEIGLPTVPERMPEAADAELIVPPNPEALDRSWLKRASRVAAPYALHSLLEGMRGEPLFDRDGQALTDPDTGRPARRHNPRFAETVLNHAFGKPLQPLQHDIGQDTLDALADLSRRALPVEVIETRALESGDTDDDSG